MGVLSLLFLFFQIQLTYQNNICILELEGEFWVSEILSFNQSLSFSPVQSSTGGLKNISVSFDRLLSPSDVEKFINGTLFGRVTSFQHNMTAHVENIGENCTFIRPLRGVSCYNISRPQSFSAYEFDNSTFYVNETISNSTFTNISINMSTPGKSISNETIDFCLFLAPFRNFSNIYYSCRCPSPMNISQEIKIAPNLPHPPVVLTYVPETHSLLFEFITQALVPRIWLQSDRIPWANCSKIFDDDTLMLLSDENFDQPKCRWLNENPDKTTLGVDLSRQSLLRTGNKLTLRFSLQIPNKEIVSSHIAREKYILNSTVTLLTWRFYSSVRDSYLREICSYQQSKKENTTRNNAVDLDWNIEIFTSSSSPTSLPSHLPTSRPTTPPSLPPSTHPSIVPTLLPSHLPNYFPTSPPSRMISKQPSNHPSSFPTPLINTNTPSSSNASNYKSELIVSRISYSISFRCILRNDQISLKVSAPSRIFSPCREETCVCKNLSPENDLVLDASASHSNSIFPLSFTWRILAVSLDPLCLNQDCLPYTSETLSDASQRIQNYLQTFGSSDVVRIPHSFLLIGTRLKFEVHGTLRNSWCENMTDISDSSTFYVAVTALPIPTLTVAGFYSITHQDMKSYGNQLYFQIENRSVYQAVRINHSPFLLTPQLVFPSDFPLFSNSLEFTWELLAIFFNSTTNTSSTKHLYNSSRASFLFQEIHCNIKDSILHLTVQSRSMEDLKSSISAFAVFDCPTSPNPTILGGSRCAHSDVPIIFRGLDNIGRLAARTYTWSCWVVDTTNRDSYNVGESHVFDPYSQCTSGIEFDNLSGITDLDRMKTIGDHVSGGCHGYQISLNEKILETSRQTLKIPPGALEIGVKYKICLEISYLDTQSTSAPFCVGIYIYIPLNTDAIHYTGINKTELVETRTLQEISSSWKPYELLSPFLRLHRDNSNASTKYVMNSEEMLKLTFGLQTSDDLQNRPICDEYLYPNTNWTFRPLLPSIYEEHRNFPSQEISLSYPLSNGPLLFGYFSLELPRNILSPGLSYSFSLSSNCPLLNIGGSDGTFNQRGFAEIIVEIRSPPRNGRLEIFPDAGIAFETLFSIRQHDWIPQDFDLPLHFSFYYSAHESYGNLDVFNIPQFGEFLCLQDWSERPYVTTAIPLPMQSLTFFGLDAMSFWNKSYGFGEYQCPVATLYGFVRDSSGAYSSLTKIIQICPPWQAKIQKISGAAYLNNPIVAGDLHNQLVADFVETLHQYIHHLLTSQFQTIKLSENFMKILTFLYGLTVALNSYPTHFLHNFHQLYQQRIDLRKSIFQFLKISWEHVGDNLRRVPLYYHLILALVHLTAIPDEIEERLKIEIVDLIQTAIVNAMDGAQGELYIGYFSPSFCSSFYSSKVFETISDLLTTLDRIAPSVERGNLTQANFNSRNETLVKRKGIYKNTILKLKDLMVGCSLPGGRVGTGANSNSWQFNGTHNSTIQPVSRINQTDLVTNLTLINTSSIPTLSPTSNPKQKLAWLENPTISSGSQIGVLRQSALGFFSEAAVTVGNTMNQLFQTRIRNITYLVSTNISNETSPIIFKTSGSTNTESTSYLQFPCDTTRSNSCQMSSTQLTLSQNMKNEKSIQEVFSLISQHDSIVDISIFNVPLFESSLSAKDSDRSWIPLSEENYGVSDAVIVEFKAYEKLNTSIFNLTTTIEVGVKISRPDVLWKLAVIGSTEQNSTKSQFRFLRNYPDQVNVPTPKYLGNQEEPQIIFSPRWVRCELFDSAQEKWMQPDWLDGWWSPDVASFATEGELQNAANKYVANHFTTYAVVDHPRKSQPGYLAGNSSAHQLPSALSCFLNSISISSSQSLIQDTGIWLQWRTVSQTQDPCGGCSGHGICVLFRTSPICLCQTDFRGRFCDEHSSTNSTDSGAPSRQWYLHSSWTASGLKSVGYLLCIISSIVILFQVIKRALVLMISGINHPHPLYNILPVETESMVVSRYVGNNSNQVNSNQPILPALIHRDEYTWSSINQEDSLLTVFPTERSFSQTSSWAIFRAFRLSSRGLSSRAPLRDDDDEDIDPPSQGVTLGEIVENHNQFEQEEERSNDDRPQTLVRGISNFSRTSRVIANQEKTLRQRKPTQY